MEAPIRIEMLVFFFFFGCVSATDPTFARFCSCESAGPDGACVLHGRCRSRPPPSPALLWCRWTAKLKSGTLGGRGALAWRFVTASHGLVPFSSATVVAALLILAVLLCLFLPKDSLQHQISCQRRFDVSMRFEECVKHGSWLSYHS
ncbi:hypothetical protein M758_3G222900 [Ceratodon purpureus]|nr:hypothetical protein M758_3G222900 [Ceratodon purpureus]